MTVAVCFRSYCQNEFGWMDFLDKKAVEMHFFLICNLKNGDKLPPKNPPCHSESSYNFFVFPLLKHHATPFSSVFLIIAKVMLAFAHTSAHLRNCSTVCNFRNTVVLYVFVIKLDSLVSVE